MITETVSIEDITPGKAEHLLTLAYDHQRVVTYLIVERYAREMSRGEWRDCESAIIIAVRSEGHEYLINGQHRLHAVIASGTKQKFMVRRIPYETDAAMDLAYANMDRGSRRSTNAQVHAMGLGETYGVSDTVCRMSIAALRLVMNNFQQSNVKARQYLTSPGDMLNAVSCWGTAIYAYHHSLLGAPGRVQSWFWRAEVAAVALVTFRYAPEKASAFWHRVALHEDILVGSPEYLLYTMLATLRVGRAGVRGTLSRRVAAAWNAAYHDRAITRLVALTEATANITIAGTPWKHGEANIDTLKIVFSPK